ncbi:MAG: HD domain-containing protein [Sulfurimonas sp.]|uniref:HD domain-containing protein n=1 Tax=Sulfurimonas sp. TaxID=2022749 RepID=UPI002609A0B8|nr:HD domain-containing protein [Sulfurimonas sp.]MDD2652716.1 HD domain-containing protein [Sulfurimonas sp.]MDD3450650.1 HD domain-containing protein [Sulfurimonas sp.]
MNKINNSLFSKPFLKSLFFVQNKWHQHGVLVHTLCVIYHILKAGEFRFLAAGLLHDIGKPFCAFKKDEEDREFDEYSFTDHEERSYEIIKDWNFISSYTKELVRYHYLIRDVQKSKTEDFGRYERKKKIWDGLSEEFKKDVALFMSYDDLGKGKRRR